VDTALRSTEPGGLSLRVLGALEFDGAGAEAATAIIDQPKRLALLVYLAASLPRGFRRRDELVALLWPESDAHHARNSLRQSLHVLRQHLPAGTVLAHGSEDVALCSRKLRLDCEELEHHLDLGREAEGLALYRGELLAGCHLADSPEFDVWIHAERERLTRRVVRAALVLAKRCEMDGNTVPAAEWARFAEKRAPYDEDVLHEVVDLLQLLGDRAGAAQLHAAAVERFQSQLGITLMPNGENAAFVTSGHSGGKGAVVAGRSYTSARWRPEAGPTPYAPVRARLVSTEARRMYLEAREYSAQRSPATISRAIEGFDGALRLAPDYAEAHAGLAFALAQATVYIGYLGCDTWPRIRTHASRAIRLDPSLGEAHALLAQATLCYDYDWVLAEQMYRRALELDPISEVSRQAFAMYLLTASGRTEEALEILDRTRDIAPHAHGISTFYAMSCVYGRQFERGRREAAAVLTTQPTYAQAHWVHGMALEGLGDTDAAVEAFEVGLALTKGSSLLLSQLGRACASGGYRERALDILSELDRRAERGGPGAYFSAEILAALGDPEAAIDRLNASYRQRNPFMVFAGVLFGLDPLRDHRRFQDLLLRMGIRRRAKAA
jgi:DNA-binding SARP family transcriptional activator/Tfp pilus assembly protein PilF